MRELKNQLYEQVARIGKAVASPKRLELIELLCQGEKTVEMLAAQAEISVKLASAHLKELRLARLVDTRKDGKYVLYRLASTSVADLWVNLRSEAEERLVELQMALTSIVEHGKFGGVGQFLAGGAKQEPYVRELRSRPTRKTAADDKLLVAAIRREQQMLESLVAAYKRMNVQTGRDTSPPAANSTTSAPNVNN